MIHPATLDTLAFAPFPPSELPERALASRPDMDLFEHELGFIRRRVVGRDADKPSLIVLPDGPATIESYDAFIAGLSDRFNVAIVEIPGFGWSWPKRAEAMAFAASCEMLAAAITDLDLARAVLVGPCVQALHAVRVADLRPEAVQALILAQCGDVAASREWAKVLDPQGTLIQPFVGQASFRLVREKVSLGWWVPFAGGPHTPTQTLQATGKTVMRAGSGYALASQMQDLETLNALAPPAQPTAILWGLADQSHADTDKRTALNLAPHATYRECEHLAHFVDLEDPELIAATALDLLG